MSAPLVTRRRAVAVVLAVTVVRPATAAGATDVEQLERLLALEHRLEAAYQMALERDLIERALGETLLGHEREHVRALTKTIRARGGGEPRASVRVGPALTGRAAFARHALDLEAETVAAYQGVLATLRDERLLQPLGSIMAAGAQHEIALRDVAGEPLLPLA